MHLRVLLIIALCALLARPAQAQAQAQAESETARRDSLSEKLETMVDAKAAKRENAALRIAKKVVSGTLTTVFLTAILFNNGVSEALSDGSYSDDGMEGIGLLYVGNLIGFPLGVSAVDPHDSFGKTLLGSSIVGLGALGLVLVGTRMESEFAEFFSELGFMASFVAPPIVSITISEKSRKPPPPQDSRISFGLAPMPIGGLSASTTLHF